MSAFMHYFIVVVTIVSLLACVWLIRWSARQSPEELADSDTMGHRWDGDLEEYNNPLPRWWLILFYLTIIYSVGYLIVYPGMGTFAGTTGWSQTNQYDEEMAAAAARYEPIYERFANTPLGELTSDAEAMALGRSLYANYCSTCHGSDARGARGFPNLTDTDWLWGGSIEAIEHSIKLGRNGVMPAFAAAVPEAEQPALVAYVQSLSTGSIDPALAETGARHYNTVCVACHGADGGGNQALGSPPLNDDVWLYGGSSAAITEGLTQGRNGQMPAHGELLGANRTKILAAYIYSLSMP